MKQRYFLLTLVSFLLVHSLFGDVPAKGVKVPERFSELMERISQSYGSGGLAVSMQKIKVDRMQSIVSQPAAALKKVYLPLILGRYSNTTERFSAQSFTPFLFTGPNNTGTMVDYYKEVSYAQFEIQGSTYGWYTAPQTQAYYTGSDNGLSDGGARFIKDLVSVADANVNFSQFDNDGPDGIPNSGDDDGYVDAVMVVHTGGAAEMGDGDNIWSHRFTLSGAGVGAYTTNDAKSGGGFIKINDYTIQPELQGDGSPSNPQVRIGIFCHEFGHILGLPDLYDTKKPATSEGVGNWCLMGGGSYGGDGKHPEKPSHLSAWCKEKLGWLVPTTLKLDQNGLSLKNVEQNQEILKLWSYGNPGLEYFLIENRQKTGFDEWLPESGLLIWHIDNSRTNNNDEQHKLVDLEEADGKSDLDNQDNRGDAGDVYPGSTDNRSFDANSSPSSRDYNGNDTKVAILNITRSSNNITLDVKIGTTSSDNSFIVYNDGTGLLQVASISSDKTWLSASPSSFSVQPGSSQRVIVSVDWAQLASTGTGKINVKSNDSDNPSIDVSVTAIPKGLFTLVVISNPQNGGATIPSGTNTYNSGTIVQVGATPNSGWEFTGWSGDTTAPRTANPLNVVMWKNKSITANFQRTSEFILTVSASPSNGGATTPSGSNSFAAGSTVQLTATPKTGWTFDGWSGDTTAPKSSNPLPVVMWKNKTIASNFITGPGIAWQTEVTVSDGGASSGTLTFGQAGSATDGLDYALGEAEAPPSPPTGVFDARFLLPVTPAVTSVKDFRSTSLTTVTWTMTFQPGPSGYPLTFSWNSASLPTGNFQLKDAIGGLVVNVDMKSQSSYTLTNSGVTTLKIEFSATGLSKDVAVNDGWNLVSVPVQASDMSVSGLFPDAASPAYGFTNGYVSATTLSVGKGYWLKFNSAKTYSVVGSAVRPASIGVSAGWNIIGPFDFDFATSSITSTPTAIVVSPYYGYSNGYTTATTLTSGKGYWVKASQAGTLNLQAPSGKMISEIETRSKEPSPELVAVEVEDANGGKGVLYLVEGGGGERVELPPVPPQGVFDVRFASNASVEDVGLGQHEIQMRSVAYPVKVVARRANGKELWINDGLGGGVLNARLEEGKVVTIGHRLSRIVLSERNQLVGIPQQYELSQNYPNPFNPTTVIRFALPEVGRVRLSLYNVLGEKVAELLDGERAPGYHQVEFNAGNIPSGVYFYRLEAGRYLGTRKLAVVK